MTFAQELAQMAADCRDTFGTEVKVRREVRGAWNSTTGTHAMTQTETVVQATRGKSRVTTGEGGRRVQETPYSIVASDLSFIPNTDDRLYDAEISTSVDGTITRVEKNANLKIWELMVKVVL